MVHTQSHLILFLNLRHQHVTSTDGKTDILVFRYNGSVWQEVGRTLNLSES